MALLEGGAAAVATSSGQAAQFMAILAIAGAGDNIVAS
jgi:O-acetylhomoserine/O-acetylserine sulfhydrylase